MKEVLIMSLIYVLLFKQGLVTATRKFDHLIEDCDSREACSNEGVCTMVNGRKKCTCLRQYYYGKKCDKVSNNCEQSILGQNCKDARRGVCRPMFGTIYCQCSSSGYHGQFCEIPFKLIPHWCSKFNMYFVRRLPANTVGTAIFACNPVDTIFPNHLHQKIVVNLFEQLFILKITMFVKMTEEHKTNITDMNVPKEFIDNKTIVHQVEFQVLRKGPVVYKATLTDDYRYYTKGWTDYAIELDGPYTYAAYNDPRTDGCHPEVRLLGAGASPFFGSAVFLQRKKDYKITTAIENMCEEDNFNPTTYQWKFYVFGNLTDFYQNFTIDDLNKLKPKKTAASLKQNTFQLDDFFKPDKPVILSRKYAVVVLNMTEGNKSAVTFGWMITPEFDVPISYIEGGKWAYVGYNQNLTTFKSKSYKNVNELGKNVPKGTLKLEWSCWSIESICYRSCMDMKKKTKNTTETWKFKIGQYEEETKRDCDIEVKLKTIYEQTREVIYSTQSIFTLKLRLNYDTAPFGIKCLRNCYWVDYADDHVKMDPHEILYVQVTCFDDPPTCTKKSDYTFNWGFVNNDGVSIYTDELFHYMDEPNVAIVYKSYLLEEISRLTIVLGTAKLPTKVGKQLRLQQKDDEYVYQEVAQMHFDTRATAISRKMDSNEPIAKYESCPSELEYRGTSFTTEFELCIPDDSYRLTSFTYMFFQKFGDFTPGVMVAWGQSNYVTKIILAASQLTSISVFRIQDATEIETEFFHDPVYVAPKMDIPDLQEHFNLIFNVFNGSWSRFVSIENNTKFNEISEIVQKYNALIHEKQIMYYARLDLELIYFIEDFNLNMFKILFNNISNVDYTLSIETYQMATLYHEILMFTRHPVHRDLLKLLPEKIQNLSTKAFSLLLPDKSTTRMHRILEISSRLIECCAVLIYPNEEIFTNEAGDFYTDNIITAAEEPDIPLYLEPLDQDSEDYPYPSLNENFTKELTKAAYKSMETVTALSHLVAVNLVPKQDEILDKSTNFPGVIFDRMRSKIDWSFYVNVKTAQKEHFIELQEIGDPLIGIVSLDDTFCASHDKTFFSLQFIIAPFNPFFWTNKSRYIINYPFMIKLTKNTEGLNIPDLTNATKESSKKKSKRQQRALPTLEEKNIDIEEPLRVIFPVTYPQNFTMGEALYYSNEKRVSTAAGDDRSLSKFKLTVDDKTPNLLIWEFALIDKAPSINVSIEANGAKIMEKTIIKNDRLIMFDWTSTGATPEFDIVVVAKPGTPRNTLYGVSVSGVECLEWASETSTDWETSCDSSKINVDTINNTISCVCKSSSTKVYAISIKPLDIKPDGWLSIDLKFEVRNSSIIFLTFVIFFLMYIYLLFRAGKLDKNDYTCKIVQYLIDNREGETYPYYVIVSNGTSKTTSNIGIKLYGTYGNSKRHVLRGINPSRPGSTHDYYVLTTDESLGQLRSIELWIDYRGNHPEWYCVKMVIRNCIEKCEWEFKVNKRFSLANTNLKDHHFITYKAEKSRSINRIFDSDQFIFRHLWFGMLRRKWCHGYSRIEHVTCAFGIIFISMAIVMLIIGITSLSSKADADFCDISWSYAVFVGLNALSVAILIVYPMLYIFRNSKMRGHMYCGIDRIIIPAYRQFPYWIKLVALIILIILIIIFSLIVLFYGFTFGERKSLTWLLSILFIFMFDVFIVETIHVILRNFLYYGIFGKKDPKYFCKTLLDFNYENQLQYLTKGLKKLILKKDMVRPLPKPMKVVLRTREEKYFRYRKMLVKNVFFGCLLICILYLVSHTTQKNAYYHALVYKKMFDYGLYTNTQPLRSIDDNKKFLNFLNYTLLVSTNWRKPHWVISGDRKVLGRIRLRQLRLKPFLTCIVPKAVIHYVGELCHGPLEPQYMDKRIYGTKWTLYNASENRQLSGPYVYHYGEHVEFMPPTFGYRGKIPTGGYYAYFGRSLLASRKILNQLTNQFWFDFRTRYITVEFASFSADSNFLTIVKLMIEKTPSDSYNTAHHILAIRLRRSAATFIPHYITIIVIPAAYAIFLTLIWYFYFQDRPTYNIFQYYNQYLSVSDLFMMLLILIYAILFHTLQIAMRKALHAVGRILVNKSFEDFTYIVQIFLFTQYLGSFLIFFNITYLSVYLAVIKRLRSYFLAINLSQQFYFPLNFMCLIMLVGFVMFLWLFGVQTFGTVLKFSIMSINITLLMEYLNEYLNSPNSIFWTVLIGLSSIAVRICLVFVCCIITRLQFAYAWQNQKEDGNVRKTYRFSFKRYWQECVLRRVNDMNALRKYHDERRYKSMERVDVM